MKLKISYLVLLSVIFLKLFQMTNALTCSEVEFCSNLRGRPPAAVYVVDFYTIEIDEIGIIKFNVIAVEGIEDVQVTIYAYKDDVLRIKIKEFNSTRYELSDIFDGAPNLAGISGLSTDASGMTITTNLGSVLYVAFTPFRLDFSRNGVLQLVLRGDRLFIDNPLNSHAFGVGLVFLQSEVLYGLHQHPTGLPLRYTQDEEPYRLYNIDRPNYPINETASVYGAIPFIYGHGPDFTAGVFLHNAAQQFVDILPNNEAHFMGEGGTLDVFVFLGGTPAEVLRQYLLITGVPYLPPLWSLGYHQSRYSYMTQEEVKDVVANLDNFNFQVDAIWLDLDYTDGKRYFTWNPENYTDPIEMQQNLTATNRKLVVISDPHIKAEPGYQVYDGALENDLFVRNADGSVFEGDCWPGLSSYIDFLNPEARAYYASQHAFDKFNGTTSTLAGFWNDMNEPVVFDGPEGQMPGDCLHYRDVQHKELHNAYGMLQTRATHEGLLERENRTIRPFVLSRSHFAGSQRYTAVWTGDSFSSWEYLSISYSMCLNANLMGISFCGADVAGFNGNPDNELYQRWFQAGAWLPFYRVHSEKATDRREPYLFPEDVQETVRNAIQLRYKHLPVWYTLFREYIVYKIPVIRPLFYHYPKDRNVYPIHEQLLVGRNIMVRNVAQPGVTSVPVYFPGGTTEYWNSIYNSDVYQGGEEFVDVDVDLSFIPIYYRVGSIIPRKDTVRPTSTEMYDDGYSIYVNLNTNGTAHGTVYFDDTKTLFYLNYNEYNYLDLDFQLGELLVSNIDIYANSWQFEFKIDSVITREFSELPTDGKPGKYVETKYQIDNSGKLLKDMGMKFKSNEKYSYSIKLM